MRRDAPPRRSAPPCCSSPPCRRRERSSTASRRPSTTRRFPRAKSARRCSSRRSSRSRGRIRRPSERGCWTRSSISTSSTRTPSRFGPAPPDAAEITAAIEKLARAAEGGRQGSRRRVREGRHDRRRRARHASSDSSSSQRYLRERFAPIAFADEEQAREEYEKHYVPERKAAGLPVEPFESVAEEMRQRSSERAFDEEVAKWLKELRQKSRISIYRIPVEIPRDRTPIVFQARARLRTRDPELTPGHRREGRMPVIIRHAGPAPDRPRPLARRRRPGLRLARLG